MTEVQSNKKKDEAKEKRRAELQAALDRLKPAALVRVWKTPAETVTALLMLRPDKRIHQLSMIAGVGVVFVGCVVGRLGAAIPLSDLLTLAILLGGLGGMTALYLGAEIATRLGRRLGGNGHAVALRCALAWGVAPWSQATLVVGGSVLALRGRETFAAWPTGLAAALLVFLGLAALGSIAWSVRGLLLTIAVVHDFDRRPAVWTLVGTATALGSLAAASALLLM